MDRCSDGVATGQVLCPICGTTTTEFRVWFVVDVCECPDLVRQCKQEMVNHFRCSHCGHFLFALDPPFLYCDLHNRILGFVPSKSMSDKENTESLNERFSRLVEAVKVVDPSQLSLYQSLNPVAFPTIHEFSWYLIDKSLPPSDRSSDGIHQTAPKPMPMADVWNQFEMQKALVSVNPLYQFPPKSEGKSVIVNGYQIIPGADLNMANLKGANLVGANLFSSSLDMAYMVETNLEDAQLGMTNIRWANLQEAKLMGTVLSFANIEHTYLQRANLSKARLQWAWLLGTNLREANLAGADLKSATLILAELENANLNDARLEWAKLYEANLRYATLQRSNMVSAELFRADLEGANLGGADISFAELKGANLKNATISDEQLSQVASLSGAIMADGSIHNCDGHCHPPPIHEPW